MMKLSTHSKIPPLTTGQYILSPRLSFLPTPQPDETILSIYARYGGYFGAIGSKTIAQDFFNKRTITAVMDLPSNLTAMIKSLPKGHKFSEDYLIDSHTLFPYYAFTIPVNRAAQLRKKMKDRKGNALHISMGIVANPIPKLQVARYCSLCAKEDILSAGEPYWHRAHQIPGINICSKHLVWLEESDYFYRNSTLRYKFIPARKAINFEKTRYVDADTYEGKLQIFLAQEANWILTHNIPQLDTEEIRRQYTFLLKQKGFATPTGSIRIKHLTKFFLDFYPIDFLKQLNLEPKESAYIYWLERIVRTGSSGMSPIQHLLLIYFLGHTIESLLNITPLESPFGSGPWPCLNKTCSKYKTRSIQLVNIHYKESRPVGFFKCTFCGFTYNRRGPDTHPEDVFKRNHIIEAGEVWEKKLLELAKDPKISLREKSRQLGVDTNTVKKRMSALLLKPKKLKKKPNNILTTKRNNWKKVVKGNPKLGVKALRTLIPAIYSWLYRNDRDWLKNNQPVRKQARNNNSMRADWRARDYITAPKIGETASKLRSAPGKPIRISISSIGRELNILRWFEKNLAKLPLCKEALHKTMESRADFALRRLAWAKRYCKENKIPAKQFILVRLAGIEKVKDWEEIRKALDS